MWLKGYRRAWVTVRVNIGVNILCLYDTETAAWQSLFFKDPHDILAKVAEGRGTLYGEERTVVTSVLVFY